MNDQLLIEQAYQKIYENKSVLIPRRSAEERQKNYNIALQKKVQEYIKNGSVGELYLFNTPITSLPEGLTTVGGNLDISYTPITNLPEGLTVRGSLQLESTFITSLPEGLTVEGDLNLRGTSITSLPEGLTVGGYLQLKFTPISKKYTKEQLKEMLPNVKGEIYI
jgi:hypothetical protein